MNEIAAFTTNDRCSLENSMNFTKWHNSVLMGGRGRGRDVQLIRNEASSNSLVVLIGIRVLIFYWHEGKTFLKIQSVVATYSLNQSQVVLECVWQRTPLRSCVCKASPSSQRAFDAQNTSISIGGWLLSLLLLSPPCLVASLHVDMARGHRAGHFSWAGDTSFLESWPDQLHLFVTLMSLEE